MLWYCLHETCWLHATAGGGGDYSEPSATPRWARTSTICHYLLSSLFFIEWSACVGYWEQLWWYWGRCCQGQRYSAGGVSAITDARPPQVRPHTHNLTSHTRPHTHRAGGIIPTVASELHERNIEGVVNSAIERSGCDLDDLSLVAVTTGPGLAFSLRAGVEYAKQLATRIRSAIIICGH